MPKNSRTTTPCRHALRAPLATSHVLMRPSFPRKMANVFKMFARGPIPGRTAALSYPDWRTPSVHHKKGRPSTATSHESRPGNPSLCIFCLPHRGSPRTAVGQITRKIQAWQALGILSQYQHKMLHNNAAQQRHGEKPASAPKASQTIPRAQGRQISRSQPSNNASNTKTHKLQA